MPKLKPTITVARDTESSLKPEIDFRNMVQVILAQLEITQLENGVRYGLIDPLIWDPAQQAYVKLTTQDLRIEAPNFDSAKAQFWPKFKNYVKRRTGKYIPIEITRIHRINLPTNLPNRTEPDQVNAAANAAKRL